MSYDLALMSKLLLLFPRSPSNKFQLTATCSINNARDLLSKNIPMDPVMPPETKLGLSFESLKSQHFLSGEKLRSMNYRIYL